MAVSWQDLSALLSGLNLPVAPGRETSQDIDNWNRGAALSELLAQGGERAFGQGLQSLIMPGEWQNKQRIAEIAARPEYSRALATLLGQQAYARAHGYAAEQHARGVVEAARQKAISDQQTDLRQREMQQNLLKNQILKENMKEKAEENRWQTELEERRRHNKRLEEEQQYQRTKPTEADLAGWQLAARRLTDDLGLQQVYVNKMKEASQARDYDTLNAWLRKKRPTNIGRPPASYYENQPGYLQDLADFFANPPETITPPPLDTTGGEAARRNRELMRMHGYL